MKKSILFIALLSAGASVVPEFASWMVNCDATTGYNGILVNVQSVEFTAPDVFIRSTGIPSHPIGPWNANPNDASDQAHVFRIPRLPQPATNHVSTPLGPIGVFVNGVPMFSALDARSYQNEGTWNQNAVVAEAISFDACLGHPQMTGAYHYHQVPECLQGELGDDGQEHSPIIGWARDGYPVYGPFGHTDATDADSAIVRIDSSYRMRSITQRRTLPDGTQLATSLWGPDVSGAFPLGLYVEDFEYVQGLGDLDVYNGRFSLTPEFPDGTFAYFATTDAGGDSAYPYLVGPEYFGVPILGNNHVVPPAAEEHDACIPVPTNYCVSNPNSAGTHATIGCVGSASIGDNDFTLTVSGAPGQKFGLFFYGSTQIQAPFGNGFRCVGGQVYRLNPTIQTDPAGSISRTVDFTNQPNPAGQILTGSEWNFQFYHRDSVGAGFNVSDALNVQFQS